MRKLTAFNHVSLDGFFVDSNGSMDWAHKNSDDPEWSAFVAGNASGSGVLVFGRVTYQMMASYWPTAQAMQNTPLVAERMNSAQKIVFSNSLDKAEWSNTRLISGDIVATMRNIKSEPGKDMAILGSGTIVSQFAQAGLIDEFQIVVNPIVLGSGRTLFAGVKNRLNLKLVNSRTFANGKVLLCYAPLH